MTKSSVLNIEQDESHRAPDWVSAILKAQKDDIARLELNETASQDNYDTILEYLAHHAVDITEEPSIGIEVNDKKASEIKQLTERERPGRLSSLLLPKSEHTRSWMREGGGLDNLTSIESSLDAEEDRIHSRANFHFGLGRARFIHEGEDVCAQHIYINPSKTHLCEVPPRAVHLFAKSEKLLRSLGDTALQWKHERTRPDKSPRAGKHQLYIMNVECYEAKWSYQGWKESRSLDSVFLPGNMLSSIVKDFQDFSAEDTKSWYVSHGLPYRRNYLFYGPPGVGKTSTIRALCGELNLATCFLTLGDRNVRNKDLQTALQTIPRPAMLVIEDVDAIFNENRESELLSDITFSGLLNALDGLASSDGILTVMTTNHIEKLDPALIRAGRVDRKFEFKQPGKAEIESLFASFYPEADEELKKEFANKVSKRTEKEARSIATLQEHFIFTRGLCPRESIDALGKFFKEFNYERRSDSCSHIYS